MRNYEIRKVQGIMKDQSLSVVIPRQFMKDTGIEKGDYVKIRLDSGKKQIVIERAVNE